MRSRLFAGVALVVALTASCTSGEDTAGSTGLGPAADVSSAPPKSKSIVLPSGEVLTAPPPEVTQMTVQVTFVGGPADGKVDHLPLSRLKEKITISGVVYQSSPGYPPEIIDTPQGKAEVFRPVQG